MSGDLDVKAIFGGIMALILIVGVVIPMFSALFGVFNNSNQQEVNSLKSTITDLQGQNSLKDTQIAQLNGFILSINESMGEKDKIISNLSGQISEKDTQIQNLTNELSYYKEKQYLQEISNNYYNISNYFAKIENKFFPIELSISILSLTLLSVVLKVFGIHLWIKRAYLKYVLRKEVKVEVKQNE